VQRWDMKVGGDVRGECKGVGAKGSVKGVQREC